MINFNQRGVVFACSLLLSSSAFAVNFVKFGTSHDVDFWGTTGYEDGFDPAFPSALDYLNEKGHTQINPLFTIDVNDDDVDDVFSGSEGPFDALIVSESINELSGSSYAKFENYVNDGGCLIVIGDHGDGEADFLNGVFDYGVGVSNANDGVDTFEIQAGANGTPFAGGPAQLLATNASALYSAIPGTAIYEGSEGVGVFTVQQGLGTVTAISWDYCCTDTPTTEQNVLDWYDVADRALQQCHPRVVRQVPATSPTSLIVATIALGLLGLIAIRRKYTS